MKELVPLGAEVKPQLPLFLTSWVDKTSAQCMYTMTQTRAWSISHLKAGCWYIECLKSICPVEEEELKAACDKADSKQSEVRSQLVEVQEEENEVDLSLLPEKEKNKILNQRARDAKKATDKADREATRAAAKALRETTATTAKEARKTGKSKTQSSPLHLTELPLYRRHRIPVSGIPLLHSSQYQDCSSLHHHPSWTLQGALCMFRSSSSLVPYCPLMHIILLVQCFMLEMLKFCNKFDSECCL
jgi:septal ring factor EnvC (AmiA/AmiB activator)